MLKIRYIKLIFKRLILFTAITIVSPLILLSKLFLLLSIDEIFHTCSTMLGILPGYPGSIFRLGFYFCILKKVSLDVSIGFGSFFSRRNVEIGKNVSIGAYCIIGRSIIKDGVVIASRVSIPSGGKQHLELLFNNHRINSENKYEVIKVGNNSWIGEGAIVMAEVGNNSIIGAGSVVTKPIPDYCIAVGNPAKPVHYFKKKAINYII